MSGRLREIARQSVAIAERGAYVNEAGQTRQLAVRKAMDGTRLYEPDDPIDATGPAQKTSIEVTRESTLAAARRVEGAATLVFASARNPGGGFLAGAEAQEESLARASALYACQRTAPAFYEFHRAHRDLRYSDRVIYSPGVPVFRDDKGRLLDEPYETAFLTAAAPNLGAILRNQPADAGDVPEVLRRRATRVLAIAAAHGHRSLVLGAWGCGVFRNVPHEVARAFAVALERVPCFDRVVFAIYDRLPHTPVQIRRRAAPAAHNAFAETFTTA
ncbi:TIGR02452 family protein [Dactylosporangium sp. CA-233914]|uniref:TIGR02452 family protein n=1 Tax=Dactylosporangium sp. CA-233914 TaxID=3239934 RepID=UPI003D92D4A9